MKTVEMIGMLLVIVGALNWGLVGLGMLMGAGMSWNLVNMLLGSMPMIEAVVYLLVGLSGVWMVWMKFAGGKK